MDANELAAHPEDLEFKRGIELSRCGEYFAAHEAFEAAWRVAAPDERDFFQGLVHAVVFAYQDGRGRMIGAERQREKALRRLAPYAPAHRGLNLARLLAALERGEADLREELVEADAKPPRDPGSKSVTPSAPGVLHER